MDNAARMGKSQWLSNTLQQLHTLAKTHAYDVLVQGPPLHMLHAIKSTAIRQSARVMYRNYAGMLELRQDLCFTHEPRCQINRAAFRSQHFERHVAMQHGIFRQPDRAHSAAAKKLNCSIACARKIGNLHFSAQACYDLIREKLHLGSTPSNACASRRNSSSLPVISRS